jgi:hypothetical protein
MGGLLGREALSAAFMCAVERHPLTGPEWRVFIVMANWALDKPGKQLPARIYAGGWRTLAHEGLCRTKYDDSAKRDVAKALSGLKKRGLIREAADQDNRHRRYEILPPRGGS